MTLIAGSVMIKFLKTQEYLGEYRGMSWERRNLKMDTEGDMINFFKRLEKNWADPSQVQQPQHPHGPSTFYHFC